MTKHNKRLEQPGTISGDGCARIAPAAHAHRYAVKFMSREPSVERLLRRLQSNRFAAPAIVVGVVVIALGNFTDAATRLTAAGRALLVSDPLADLPTVGDFEEWTAEFAHARRTQRRPVDVPKADEPGFVRANDAARPTYTSFVDALRSGVDAYRERVTPNLYADLPPIPNDVFGDGGAMYRGGVTFSRDCSWSLYLDAPPESAVRAGPVLRIEFMDGDGHVKSGSGIGSLRLWHSFGGQSVEIRAVGVATSILRDVPNTVPVARFESVAPFVVKLLLEHELRNCNIGS